MTLLFTCHDPKSNRMTVRRPINDCRDQNDSTLHQTIYASMFLKLNSKSAVLLEDVSVEVYAFLNCSEGAKSNPNKTTWISLEQRKTITP